MSINAFTMCLHNTTVMMRVHPLLLQQPHYWETPTTVTTLPCKCGEPIFKFICDYEIGLNYYSPKIISRWLNFSLKRHHTAHSPDLSPVHWLINGQSSLDRNRLRKDSSSSSFHWIDFIGTDRMRPTKASSTTDWMFFKLSLRITLGTAMNP